MSVNLWYLQQLPRDAGQCRIAFQVPNRGILPFAPVSSFSKPPLRGVREPIPAGFRGFRRAVQRSRIRHPAGNAGRRSQGVGAGRLLPGLDGLRLSAGRWRVHAGAGAAGGAGGGRCPTPHVHGGLLDSLLQSWGFPITTPAACARSTGALARTPRMRQAHSLRHTCDQ